MTEIEIGYQEDPKNGDGITRARTTDRIRAWEIPREQKALEALNTELGEVAFPGNYMLFEARNKVYVGEAKDLYKRLKTHMSSPDVKIQKWDHAIIINDGRSATQSDFNDTVVRKALELYLIRLLKANRYKVVSQGETQNFNPAQKVLITALKEELNFFLIKKTIITKTLEEKGQEEVFGDELQKIIKNCGMTIQKWGKYEAVINNETTFIRPGSKKTKGWQITFRGRKPGSFIDSLQKGVGSLLFSRDGVLLIPLTEVQKVITVPATYEQDTIDIWIVFSEEEVILSYKENTLEISNFRLIKG
ncbi:MAG: hypothetical protein E3J71_07990 [Candidatus Stahlbacteria bacterium]|nr:MAG: hypothetical protein E3J71_07990 [Candidatus Stahlbacteria bacterium]